MIRYTFVFAFLLLATFTEVTCFKDSHFYPCSWVGKTFKISEGNTTVGTWDFDLTGKGSILEILGEVVQLECVKIEGQFVILRQIGTDMTSCMTIHNITADVFKFYYRNVYVYKPEEELKNKNSMCDICRDFEVYIAKVKEIPYEKLTTSPKCLYPIGCTPANPRSICNENTEEPIDEGRCDRTPPKMPMMNM